MTKKKTNKTGILKRVWLALRNRVLANLIAGMLFIVPVAITIWLIKTMFVAADTIGWPNFMEQRIPGSGILFALLFLIITGAIVRNITGKRLQSALEKWLEKVPVAGSIYFAAKKFLETIAASREKSFRRVVLIEYPRNGIYTIAFVTNEDDPMIEKRTGKRTLSLFVPTTPNPTSGFLVFVPVEDCIDLSIGIDEAFRLIISGGVLSSEAARQADPPKS